MSSILILSGHTRPSLSGPINHQLYAQRHGYDYLFDATPYPLRTRYDQKTLAVLSALRRGTWDWIFWVDEDAYFMDHTRRLEEFTVGRHSADLIICRGPKGSPTDWTRINAGCYFVRSSALAVETLESVLSTDLRKVHDWWNVDELGLFTWSDQDCFVHLLYTSGTLRQRTAVLDCTAFNARSYHFESRYDEHFICHLANYRDKHRGVDDMRNRFGLDPYLMPEAERPEMKNWQSYSIFSAPDSLH